MLYMLTPEIKTNLILKEIGIKRYSLRSKSPNSSSSSLHYYQKGLILALLDEPFEDLIKQHQDLLKAIIESTKHNDGRESFKTILFSSKQELRENISNFTKLKLVIKFGNISYNLPLEYKMINAPSLNRLIEEKELKKDLWLEIKSKLSL